MKRRFEQFYLMIVDLRYGKKSERLTKHLFIRKIEDLCLNRAENLCIKNCK